MRGKDKERKKIIEQREGEEKKWGRRRGREQRGRAKGGLKVKTRSSSRGGERKEKKGEERRRKSKGKVGEEEE